MSGIHSAPYIAVVGGVNIDVCGKPFSPPVPRDSNPGQVTVSLGGVGRNIAHNLSLLGVSVSLVTALGEDYNAQRVAQSCQALGIDLSHALRVPGAATSTYVALTDHQGEMELAVSDMDIYRHLSAAYLSGHLDFLNQAAVVVVDANLPQETLDFLAQRCAAPIFADPVSTVKGEKLRGILGALHTLKANRMEAAMLSGVEIADDAGLERAAQGLLDTGLGRVFISLGPDGVLCAQGSERLRLAAVPGEMKNATGCGDAFMAALAWSFLEGLSLGDTARAALAAAAVALAGPETVNPSLSAQRVRQLTNTPKEVI